MNDEMMLLAAILGFPVLTFVGLGIAYIIATLTDH